jgi:integrase
MSQTQYLQRRHQTWYVVVEVPKPLRSVLGKPRLIRSLKTQSLQEANQLKHAVVAEFKRQLGVVEKAPNGVEAKALVKALSYRREYLAADPTEVHDLQTGESFSERQFVVDDIRFDAERLQDKAGPELANRFIRIATGEVTPFEDLPEQWLTELKGQLAEQTRSQHRTAVQRFLAWAGDHVSVEEVTRRKAGEYISQQLLPSGGARRTVKRQVSSLSSFWRWLISRGLAQDNPWRGHELGKGKPGRQRKGFSDDELKKLLSGSYTDRYDAILYDLIRLAIVTGARLEELCGLKVDDVELRDDGWWITVQQGKTEAARRSIPVHASVAGILERRKADGGPYLFKHLDTGGPDKKRSWYVSKAFRRYRERVGVAGVLRDFHALRNTYIAMMEGEDVKESTVKLLVGHKRSSMTYGHYSKGERVKLRDAVNKLSYGPEVMALLRAKGRPEHARARCRRVKR